MPKTRADLRCLLNGTVGTLLLRFAELKNTCKNRFAWAIGVSYHIRIRQKNLNDAAGSSTLGCVPSCTITLSDPDERTYLHELGHTLGLIHEQQRHDRDKYVTIYWKKLKLGIDPSITKMGKTLGYAMASLTITQLCYIRPLNQIKEDMKC